MIGYVLLTVCNYLDISFANLGVEGKEKMKRLMAMILVIIAVTSATAYALDFGDVFGGMTTIFSSDNDEVTYGVGEKGVVDDVTATLVKVSESKGNKGYKPADGNVYLICEFKVENNNTEDLFLSTMICFNTSCDDTTYQLSVEALAISALSGVFQMDQMVETGKKVNGVVGYEVPKGWKELKIRFTPQGWGGDSMTFVASR